MRITQRFKKSWQAEDGVAAIEFAAIAPVLLLLMLGTIEYSILMMTYNVMEGATVVSSRVGKTGYTETNLTREQTIIEAIKARAGSLINPDKLTVTAKSYAQYDQINDPEPFIDANGNNNYNVGESYTDINGNGQWDLDMGAAGYGGAEDIVVYEVSYPWKIATPILSNILGVNGTHTIITHAVVKNEPY